MELYLMQHGVAFSKDVNPGRPLSPVGAETVGMSARALAMTGLRLDAILASPKERAVQTAGIVARNMGLTESAVITTETLKPMAKAAKFLEFLKGLGDAKRVFVAGHMPSLGEIASLFISSASVALQIENAGLTRIDVLDFSRPAGVLMWHLTPHQLQLMAGK